MTTGLFLNFAICFGFYNAAQGRLKYNACCQLQLVGMITRRQAMSVTSNRRTSDPKYDDKEKNTYSRTNFNNNNNNCNGTI